MLDQKIVQQVKEIVDSRQRFLLQFHLNPDPDSVCSALAFALVLKNLGKEVVVSRGDSALPDFLNILPGQDLVVDKSVSAIDLNNFEVFLILDTSTIERMSAVKINFPASLKTVVIDHHITNPKFGQINLLPDDYPATAQILFELFHLCGWTITPDIAANLFLGLYTDTGGFRFRGTTSDTLAAASNLAQIYPDFPKLLFALMNNNTPAAILYEQSLLESLTVVGGGQVALVGIDYASLRAKGITENDMHDGVASKLISVKDWQIGITLVEVEPGMVKVSLRSRDQDKYDVAKVAAVFGGGGHKAAAGARIAGAYPEAKQQVVDAIHKIYPHLA